MERDAVSPRIMALQLVAGGVSGAVTKTLTAPLERVKILLQLQGMKQSGKYKNIRHTLRTIVVEEGWIGLFRGNGANVLRVIPVYALKFSFNDTFKNLVRKSKDEQLSVSQLMVAGTLAGLFQTCVTYPLETIRTRLTLGTGLGSQYSGIADVARATFRHEGFAGFYKGIGPTMLTGSPYVGLQMASYDLLNRPLPRYIEDPYTMQFAKLFTGALAGIFAQTLTYPGDTVRRRMQTNGMAGEAKMYANSWDCVVKIVRIEGAGKLFAGSFANVVRGIPGAAIQFAAYDVCKVLLGIP